MRRDGRGADRGPEPRGPARGAAGARDGGGTVNPTPLTPPVLDLVADRFRVLGEPARLRLLQAPRHAPRRGGELAEATGLSPANVSKHLQILHAARFVERRKEGLHVYYG